MLEKCSDFDVGGKTSRKKVNVLHLLNFEAKLKKLLVTLSQMLQI